MKFASKVGELLKQTMYEGNTRKLHGMLDRIACEVGKKLQTKMKRSYKKS
jgi:hypothetical protein